MEPLILKVSPFYTGRGWYDPKSGLNFRKEYGDITVPEGKDLLTIKRDIKNNALIVISGSIEAYEKAREAAKVKTEVVVEAPKVETVVTVEAEVKVENEQVAKTEIIEEKEKTVAEAPKAPKKTGGAKKTAAKKE